MLRVDWKAIDQAVKAVHQAIAVAHQVMTAVLRRIAVHLRIAMRMKNDQTAMMSDQNFEKIKKIEVWLKFDSKKSKFLFCERIDQSIKKLSIYTWSNLEGSSHDLNWYYFSVRYFIWEIDLMLFNWFYEMMPYVYLTSFCDLFFSWLS